MIILKMFCDINFKWKKLVILVEVIEKLLFDILEQWEEFKLFEEFLDKLFMEIKDFLFIVEGEDYFLLWFNN